MGKSRANPTEVDLAGKVQQLLFPKSSPVCNWCCMGVKNEMAEELGGDYFDFIEMPDECQVIFLGDVTGHGLHASIIMSLLYGFIHHNASRDHGPLELAAEANTFLRYFARRSTTFDHFFSSTLFYSIIDPDSLVMRYVNAGHVPPMVRRGDRVSYLLTTAHPLGFFEEPELDMNSFQLEKGDRLLLYTDGITETFNPQEEAFGRDRLESLLLEHPGEYHEFLGAVFADLDAFRREKTSRDDCTAIVLDINGR